FDNGRGGVNAEVWRRRTVAADEGEVLVGRVTRIGHAVAADRSGGHSDRDRAGNAGRQEHGFVVVGGVGRATGAAESAGELVAEIGIAAHGNFQVQVIDLRRGVGDRAKGVRPGDGDAQRLGVVDHRASPGEVFTGVVENRGLVYQV